MLLSLLGIFVHLQDSSTHIYVEVVLHDPPQGTTIGEGDFLEDPNAPHIFNTMEMVSKLG